MLGHQRSGGVVQQVAVLDRAHSRPHGALDRLRRVRVGAHVRAPRPRLLDRRRQLIRRVLRHPDRIGRRRDTARRHHLDLLRPRSSSSRAARRTAATPSATCANRLEWIVQAQSCGWSASGRKSPWPPVWLSTRPEWKMRGPRMRPRCRDSPFLPRRRGARRSREAPSSSTSREPELAPRHDDRRAADADARLVDRPVHSGREHRRALELGALLDADGLSEREPAVADEMEGEWSRRGAGRRILGDAARRREHARLPALAGAGEDIRSPGHDRGQRGEIGTDRGDRLGRRQPRRRRGRCRCRSTRPGAPSPRPRARREAPRTRGEARSAGRAGSSSRTPRGRPPARAGRAPARHRSRARRRGAASPRQRRRPCPAWDDRRRAPPAAA